MKLLYSFLRLFFELFLPLWRIKDSVERRERERGWHAAKGHRSDSNLGRLLQRLSLYTWGARSATERYQHPHYVNLTSTVSLPGAETMVTQKQEVAVQWSVPVLNNLCWSSLISVYTDCQELFCLDWFSALMIPNHLLQDGDVWNSLTPLVASTAQNVHLVIQVNKKIQTNKLLN